MCRQPNGVKPPAEIEAVVTAAYDAFNRRDVDAALSAMTEDVEWANGWEGGHVKGRSAVRDYWRRQWAEIDPHVTPLDMALDDDGRVVVEVQQEVRDRDGSVLVTGRVRHGYRLEDGLVARFDILEAGDDPRP
jgi:ketosteroid isomerase-like protein